MDQATTGEVEMTCHAPYSSESDDHPTCVNPRRCAEVGYCTWETLAALEMP